MQIPQGNEFSSCGVGFVANLRQQASHENVRLGLKALANLEHRGGSSPDGALGDGAGILMDIPHALLGLPPGDALANLLLPTEPTARIRALRIFEETFASLNLEVYQYREVPVNDSVLTAATRTQRPGFLMAFIRRPEHCTSRHSFERLLYTAKQQTRSRLRTAGIVKQFFFSSLSAATVVYKALLPSGKLAEFFPDLANPKFETRFALFHRRFSTNTVTAWDTAQPFRIVAHNGEINTISGNRAWAYARERALGLRQDELLTHLGISDSGSVNEMIEALMYRSSISHPEDILSILMPQAGEARPFHRFWGRAMEPWEGPALFTYSDGRVVGARLDRNGFRPCRWARTKDHFYLSSEAGSFEIPETEILAKGALPAGGSIVIDLRSGRFDFRDASALRENQDAQFDPRLTELERVDIPKTYQPVTEKVSLFGYSEEDLVKVLFPMIRDGKEGIGSMGDTARLAAFSSETRTLFDFFYQRFAQVTNPPLDYLREKMVTDLTMFLGRRPNIFEPKELIPVKGGIQLPSPVLSLGQMEFLKSLSGQSGFEGKWPGAIVFDMTFPRAKGVKGLKEKIDIIREQAGDAIRRRVSIFILSDRKADAENPPIPSVLLLASLVQGLNQGGMRLRAGLVVDTGEVRSPHQLSVLTAFGANAVCPYLALELARFGHPSLTTESSGEENEARLIEAFESGLLRIMSKMGISTARSYQASELFTILGFSKEIHQDFFPRHESRLGGLTLEQIVDHVLRNSTNDLKSQLKGPTGLYHNYLFREHPKLVGGEKHSVTIQRSKQVHRAVNEPDLAKATLAYREYLKAGTESEPISIRHLLKLKGSETPKPLEEVQSEADILSTFGSGAMSFGAISAESQRDIIHAMKEIGGRSNSGEGGENPFYYVDGTSASTKQIASGRFGVTAEYLMAANEFQIKIGQGAKPGEGGQLMAPKVSADIARARHSEVGVDLISPPPMHDIYSIEDLKQLVYELRQLKPEAKVSVKLVSGENIGTIAVGVAKAGADIIHISGHDGGTGAASLGSMKHAGLPWELGLLEVHRLLVQYDLRASLTLRVDGGLMNGRDVVTAAVLGADEFDFGKVLLVAEGCIMARVCEKNTCPTGIATHDPKFKRLYRGNKDVVVRWLKLIANDVRENLAQLGSASLNDVIGRTDLLEPHPQYSEWIAERHIDLSYFVGAPSPKPPKPTFGDRPYFEPVSDLNGRILAEYQKGARELSYAIRPFDRAALATLIGALVKNKSSLAESTIKATFKGSAGQGFGVFLVPGLDVRLVGEANDSVGKSMSGGRIVVVPPPENLYLPEKNSLIGNCALYGATGGTLYAYGLAGNRFGVRNSGATAVVEGVGMHAAEYMTGGRIVILGETGLNVGAGMSGGEIYLKKEEARHLNTGYVDIGNCDAEDLERLRSLLVDYQAETASKTATALLAGEAPLDEYFIKVLPKARALRTSTDSSLKSPAPKDSLPDEGSFSTLETSRKKSKSLPGFEPPRTFVGTPSSSAAPE